MIRLGLNAKLYRNTGSYASPTWAEVENVKDLTLTLEKSEADVTTRGNDGWRATLGTLKDASIEFQMVYDTADADWIEFKDAFLNDETIELAIMDGPMVAPVGTASEDRSQGLRASFNVLSFTRTEELENALMSDVTVKPTYAANAPSWMTGTVAT